MQVGLVGVAAVGRDSGRVFTRGQAVGGVVEADQLRGAFGRQADLRVEPGPQAFAAPSDLRRQSCRPGPGRGRRGSGPRPRPPPDLPAAPPDADGRATRRSTRTAPPTTRHRSVAHGSVTPAGPTGRRGPRRRRPGRPGRRPEPRVRSPGTGAPARHSKFSPRTRTAPPAPNPSPATTLPRCCRPAASSTMSEPAPNSSSQCHGRVRDRPVAGVVMPRSRNPAMRDTGHPAGPRRACDVPHRRTVHARPARRPMLRGPADGNIRSSHRRYRRRQWPMTISDGVERRPRDHREFDPVPGRRRHPRVPGRPPRRPRTPAHPRAPRPRPARGTAGSDADRVPSRHPDRPARARPVRQTGRRQLRDPGAGTPGRRRHWTGSASSTPSSSAIPAAARSPPPSPNNEPTW